MVDVAEQLQEAREGLLDLTMRNRLLNFQDLKRSTATVVDEVPRHVYKRLVLDEVQMRFTPAPEDEELPDRLETRPPDEVLEVEDDGTHRCLLCSEPTEEISPAADPDDPARPDPDDEAPGTRGSGDRTDRPEPGPDQPREEGEELDPPPGPPPTDAADEASPEPSPTPPRDRDEGPAAPTRFTDRQGVLDHLESEHDVLVEGEEEVFTESEIEDLWSLPEPGEALDARHQDDELQTPHTDSDLQKRLYHVNNRAEALVEDAGYNALHLALGFLEYQPDPRSEESRRAPLLLVPVELRRRGAGSTFRVRWNGEEVQANLTLQRKLEEQGIELPDLGAADAPEEIHAYLQDVSDLVGGRDGWRVAPDIRLGFFNFTKFIMYKDLDPEAWPEEAGPADDPLVEAVLDPTAVTDEPEPFPEDRIDEATEPGEALHVLDADPSQVAALEDVKRGRNLVVEGPPGTGKSQTIVNAIAELLAEGKTVLFVSEKMAALDVVKSRLDDVGLGDFCLELHSDKARKKKVLEELERLARIDGYEADVPREPYEQLERRRAQLDAYVDAIRTPYGGVEEAPFDLIGQREEALRHFEDGFPLVDLPDARDWTTEQAREARNKLRDLDDHVATVAPVPEHPWQGADPGTVLPADREAVEEAIDEALAALDEAAAVASDAAEAWGFLEPRSLADAADLRDGLEALAEIPPTPREILEDDTWNRRPRAAGDLLDALRDLRELEADVGERTDPDLVAPDPGEVLDRYQRLHPTWTRLLRPSWWRLKGVLSSLYEADRPSEPREVVADLQALVEIRRLQAELGGRRDEGRDLFGPLWDGPDTDLGEAETFARWAVELRTLLREDRLEADVLDRVASGVNPDALRARRDEVDEAASLAREAVASLFDEVGADPEAILGTPLEETPFPVLEARLDVWAGATGQLQAWSQYVSTREAVRETVAAPLVPHIEEGSLGPGDLLPGWDGALADNLLRQAFRDREALADFNADVHEEARDEFQDRDRRTLQLNRRRIQARLVENLPALRPGASQDSQAGILLHEFGKSRRLKPLRRLMEDTGALVQRLQPCFMMSPRSVAKYLDPETASFDVVIFDEASQVRPEDGLGAILRADQLVVLGDSKQLPPTSFFDHVVEHRAVEDPWEHSIQDLESILDACRTTFPDRRLRWHYRSRHESLIAVSNEAFYDGELKTYPSPHHDADHLGLAFHHLPETTYDRGGTAVNREEARAVAGAALEHYREHPDKSLGVGTFSSAQQEAVREEVELLRRQNPDLDRHFSRERDEHFFVKNLERIQGDERDVVFIIVGYGFDDEGRITRNFGPLNHDGGWRRLNVLITRARERCEVFANWTADDLDVTPSAPRGVRALERFMEAARSDATRHPVEEGDLDSPLERSVHAALDGAGYEVHAGAGSQGVHVDLAVVDPDDPQRYLVGIQCDGRSYQESPMTRDRDRLREQVLEDRGWRLHRVWSTDWFRNRDRAEERLLGAVEAARRGRDPAEADGGNLDEGPGLDEAVATRDLDDDAGIEEAAEPYERARLTRTVRLGEGDVDGAAEAVAAVVEEEGPVHDQVLQDRLREASGVARVGSRIRETIERAVRQAERAGDVEVRGDFLWPPNQASAPVRHRGPSVDVDIDHVPEAEIRAAVRTVLERQYATPRDGLVRQTGRLLGWERTGSRLQGRVGSVIEAMLREGELVEAKGDRLDLPGEE
jgi:hypothetical protein